MSLKTADKVRIFECFPFFNELDILEIHLNVLAPYIDYFIIVEATRNFMGQPKALFFEENKERFAEFSDKIIHVVVDDLPEELDATVDDAIRRRTGFEREANQRQAMSRGLANARPNDLIIISDVDEIIKPEALTRSLAGAPGKISYFEGVYYHYYLNWRLRGYKDLKTTRMIEMKNFIDGHHMRKTKGWRSKSLPNWLEYMMWVPYASKRHGKLLGRQVIREGCWHLSFIMNSDQIREKLQAYSHTERTTDEFIGEGRIEERIENKISMFGNGIAVDPVETLPKYIQDNLGKYGALIDFDGISAEAEEACSSVEESG